MRPISADTRDASADSALVHYPVTLLSLGRPSVPADNAELPLERKQVLAWFKALAPVLKGMICCIKLPPGKKG